MSRRTVIAVTAAAVLLLVAVFGGRLLLLGASAGTPDARSDLPPLASGDHRVAIVFGAGLSPDGTPSPLLNDRLLAAEELLRRGVVDRLLMSGDNTTQGHNEPSAMRRAAIARGVDPDLIALDYGGRRTWDSCRRASEIFGVTRAVVVSNDFHRARTIVVCRAAGVTVDGAVGTSTGGYSRADRGKWQVRELAASWRGVMDAWIDHPQAAVGGEPIDIYDPAAVRRSLAPEDR